jgi:hypothetical protein
MLEANDQPLDRMLDQTDCRTTAVPRLFTDVCYDRSHYMLWATPTNPPRNGRPRRRHAKSLFTHFLIAKRRRPIRSMLLYVG